MPPSITFSNAPIDGYTHTFIVLHDSGGSGQAEQSALRGWQNSEGQSLSDAFPTFKWVFPSTKGNEKQWYNARKETENPDLLRENARHILRELTKEVVRLRGEDDRIILAGIGQGAVMAAHVLLILAALPASSEDAGARRSRLGAFIAFSADEMPLSGKSVGEIRRLLEYSEEVDYPIVQNTPVLLQSSGEQDLDRVAALRDILKDSGTESITETSLAEGSQPLSPESLDNVVRFVKSNIRWKPEEVFTHGPWHRLRGVAPSCSSSGR